MLKLWLVVVSGMVSISCCGIQGAASPIERPNTPIYPKIQASELECLTDDVYTRLNLGKTMCRERVKTYEHVIDIYNESIK